MSPEHVDGSNRKDIGGVTEGSEIESSRTRARVKCRDDYAVLRKLAFEGYSRLARETPGRSGVRGDFGDGCEDRSEGGSVVNVGAFGRSTSIACRVHCTHGENVSSVGQARE